MALRLMRRRMPHSYLKHPKDMRVVRQWVTRNGWEFQCRLNKRFQKVFYSSIRDNKSIIMAATDARLRRNKNEPGTTIKYNFFHDISERMRDDKDVVMAILSCYGGVGFREVSKRLRDDRDVVDRAFAINKKSLNFASPRVRCMILTEFVY